jgi:hypothetical protein
MANEINSTVSLQVNKATIYLTESVSASGLLRDMSGTHLFSQSYDLTTSFVSIGKGAIVNPCECIIRNTNATGTVEVSMDGGTTSHQTIPAGTACLMYLTPAITISDVCVKITASTGTCRVWIVEA